MWWWEADWGGSLHPFKGHGRPTHSSCFLGYPVEAPVGPWTCQSLLWNSSRSGHFTWGKFFSKAVLHGWWFSPTRAPSAFKTCFGCVLNGEIYVESQQCSAQICVIALNKDSKCIYKGLVGNTFHWRKKKSKKNTVRFWPVRCRR